MHSTVLIGKGDFNSHAHVERDFSEYIANNTKNISTHTLTWSVTSGNISTYTDSGKISTHTLTWSVTCGGHVRKTVFEFQLTRSRGA